MSATMDEVRGALETPAGFMDWLVEVSTPAPGDLFPSRAREVGYRAACGRCPIAEYLADRFGLMHLEVSEEQIEWAIERSLGRESLVPPKWVARFMAVVDGPAYLRVASVWSTPMPVTAGEAIFVLLQM